MSAEEDIAKQVVEEFEITIVDWGNTIGQANQQFVEVEEAPVDKKV